MTNPRHAESTPVGRYYTRPGTGEKLISVTNALSVGMAKPPLVPWAAKIVAEYAVANLPSIVASSRTDRPGTVRELKSQVTVARDKAADQGSRVHELAEAHATGRLVGREPGDDEAGPYVEQYLRFLTDFGVHLDRDVEAAEMTVADPHLGVAGTLDAIIRLPIGVEPTSKGLRPYPLNGGERLPWIVDYKTSATRPVTSVYPEYALQLTGLRDMREAWMPDGTIQAMPSRIYGAAVLNLRRDSYALIPMPTGDAERRAFRAAVTIAQWVHSGGQDITGGVYRPVTPSGRYTPQRQRQSTTARKASAHVTH